MIDFLAAYSNIPPRLTSQPIHQDGLDHESLVYAGETRQVLIFRNQVRYLTMLEAWAFVTSHFGIGNFKLFHIGRAMQ
jgi:hypothetical protein